MGVRHEAREIRETRPQIPGIFTANPRLLQIPVTSPP